MSTALTPNSRIVKAITSHIETGIPITDTNYHLTPEEMNRIRVVFHLYKAWRKNPMLDKKTFLKEVHHRRTQDLPNDLYCFDLIKSLSSDLMMTKSDLMLIQQRAALEAYQKARDIGDIALELKAAKMLGDIIKDLPENEEQQQRPLDDFYTNNIRDIAPDFIPVDSPTRAKMLKKYGGQPDRNTQVVAEKVDRLREHANIVKSGLLHPIDEPAVSPPPTLDDFD